jgi:Zn-dependent M28 family amino/carboxypeptidase
MEPPTARQATIDNLRRHVDRLAGLIGPRHVGKPKALAAAAGLVESELRDAGYDVAREVYTASGANVANLIAELPGGRKHDEILILGAHYDTVAATPGADDNASAVAVLVEVARRMRGFRPKRTIRFVSFPCEEPPHFHTGEMGSQIHARNCRERNERVVGMLCLEMVGFYSTLPGSQQIPDSLPRWTRTFLPRRGDFLAAVGNLRSWRLLWQFRRGFKRATRMPLLSLALPERIHEIRLSDNSSFWDQGFPALMLTDTSFLRNPHYHLATDTPDTLDYERMADVVEGVVGAMQRIAGAQQ